MTPEFLNSLLTTPQELPNTAEVRVELFRAAVELSRERMETPLTLYLLGREAMKGEQSE